MTHIPALIQDLAFILVIASLVAIVFRRLGQPVVLGYLLVGMLLGPYTPPFAWVTDLPGIETWSQLGVIFLMFGLGLEFSFERLKGLGTAPVITGGFEAFFMLGLGTVAGRIAGWPWMDCVFLGSILSVSSTAIIVKAIEEQGLKGERFAELVFASLVVDDMAGILIMAGLTTFGTLESPSGAMLVAWDLFKLLAILASWVLIGHYGLARVVNWLGRRADDESLTLLALGLCLALVAVASLFGYSSALGAFVMGSILAGSLHVERIEHLVRPLQDVFAAVFFVATGMLLDPAQVIAHWQAVAAVALLTVVGKIVAVYLGARLGRQSHGMSMRMGLAMAQIGEFSFIIAGLGLGLKIIRPELFPIAVAVSIITTFTTPYLIRLGRPKRPQLSTAARSDSAPPR